MATAQEIAGDKFVQEEFDRAAVDGRVSRVAFLAAAAKNAPTGHGPSQDGFRGSIDLTYAAERYTKPEIAFELAESGVVQLLSLRWLQARAESGEPLPRRQDLPPEAAADMVALRAAHAALPAHIAVAVLPMVSVSYCWLKPEHPDATGEQLRHIMETLKPLAEANGHKHSPGWFDLFPDMGVFWDWGSMYQKDPSLFDANETPEAKPEAERAAFLAALEEGRAFYGGVAYERSRTEEQKAAFKRALDDSMDVWYAHMMIVTVFVTRMPVGYVGRTYDERGWTSFERSSAELIKPTAAYVVEKGKARAQGRRLWAMAIDSSVSDVNEGRRPPLAPAAFRELLATKRFTNNADADGVAQLFQKTAMRVLGATPEIMLDYVPVRKGDGTRLAQALALCTVIEDLSWNFVCMPAAEVRGMLVNSVPSLRKLRLQGDLQSVVALDEASAVALFEALGERTLPQLQVLNIEGNALGDAGALALGKVLSEGAVPQLRQLLLKKSGLSEAGGVAVARALGKGAVPQLHKLSLRNNALGEAGGAELAEALGKGAMAQMQSLYLQSCALGDAGVVALGEALSKGTVSELQHLELANNSMGECGAAALGEAISKLAVPQLKLWVGKLSEEGQRALNKAVDASGLANVKVHCK